MIFATVGTHAQPFPRFFTFVEAARDLDHEVFLQYGHNPPPGGLSDAVAFLPYTEVLRQFARADAVLTHAGVGSVLSARRAGHVPVVVTRLARHGEHVDEHQEELARRLTKEGHAFMVTSPRELGEALAGAVAARRPAPPWSAERPLHAAIRAALR